MNTAFKTVRNGALAIEVRAYARDRYGFDFTPPGKRRKQVRRTTVEAAVAKAEELLGVAHAGKVHRLEIDPEEYAEFLRWKAERKQPTEVPKLVDSLIAARIKKGVEPPTLRAIQSTLVHFAKAFPGPIADVQARKVEAWLDERYKAPRTWNNNRANILALFHHARRQGLLPVELTPVERIEKLKVKVTVETYTPAQLEKLLTVVPTEWLPFIVLGAFCGLRPSEVAPDQRGGGWKPSLMWENILWDKKKVDVPAEVAKDRRRRFPPLCKAALEFLSPWRRSKGQIQPAKHVHLYTREWGKQAGCGWKDDALRHSYASYRLALTKDIPALADEMGNSVDMIYRHYLERKHESEARAWFALRPRRAVNVISIAA
jgi:integrase